MFYLALAFATFLLFPVSTAASPSQLSFSSSAEHFGACGESGQNGRHCERGCDKLDWAHISYQTESLALPASWTDALSIVNGSRSRVQCRVQKDCSAICTHLGSSKRPLASIRNKMDEIDSAKKGPKIMIVGDSITQGHEGDFTWRYRIWQWFKKEKLAANFVGPYTGTLDSDVPKPPEAPPFYGEEPPQQENHLRTNGGYASGQENFDSRHFSLWGQQLAQDKYLIRDMVAEHKPDMLLVLLGFNDMGWFVSGPEGTLDSMKMFISESRAANPNIKLVLGNVVFRTFMNGREDLPRNTNQYNEMLEQLIKESSTKRSPIVLAHVREQYTCELEKCTAAYDGLHPNALGEYQIAQAFSSALISGFEMGKNKLVIPENIPKREALVPAGFSAQAAPSGILLTWEPVYGSFAYDVRQRSVGGDWQTSLVGFNRYDNSWVRDGDTFEYMVRTNNGDYFGVSDWTEPQTVTARPQTPQPPTDPFLIQTSPERHGIRISWSGFSNDPTSYSVIVWDQDTPGAFIQAYSVRGNTFHYPSSDLNQRHWYGVAVQGWNEFGGGVPGGGDAVFVGRGGSEEQEAEQKPIDGSEREEAEKDSKHEKGGTDSKSV